MQTLTLNLENGHPFLTLAEGTFLLDTGAPMSFGNASQIWLEGQRFDLPPSYSGLSAPSLSTYVGRATAGILGADILNRFDILIDLAQSRVGFSAEPLESQAPALALEFCMGVPMISSHFAGRPVKMFFDTGAQVSYLQDANLSTFPPEGTVADFYPGIGQFCTETFRVPLRLGGAEYQLRCGQLPPLLGMTLMLAGAGGIVGNEILLGRTVGYFPRRRRLHLS